MEYGASQSSTYMHVCNASVKGHASRTDASTASRASIRWGAENILHFLFWVVSIGMGERASRC